VILRTLAGRIRPGGIADLATAASAGAGYADPSSGLLCARVGVDRGGRDLLAVSIWESVEAAVDAGARIGDAGLDRRLADIGELDTPCLFDIGGTWTQRSTGAPILLRLAIGRFTRNGADLEMQELLRRRMPTLGEAMSEACVGRRIVDRSVEVLFYSAWIAEPPGVRLDEALWPDISLRYDSFAVRVFIPLALAAVGSPA
jgi:hypothetical protein